MSVVKMSKIRLYGLNLNEKEILSSIHKSNLMQIVSSSEIDDTFCVEKEGKENLEKAFLRCKSAVETLTDYILINKNSPKIKNKIDVNNFVVSYDEFNGISKKEKEIEKVIYRIEDYKNSINFNKAEKTRLSNLYAGVKVYENLSDKFSDYKNTDLTTVKLGTVKSSNLVKLNEYVSESGNGLMDVEVLDGGENSVILAISLKGGEELYSKLGEIGFSECPYSFDCTPKQKLKELKTQIENTDKYYESVVNGFIDLSKNLHDLKVYADYLKFCLESANLESEFRRTGSTFVLEGYTPFDKAEELVSLLKKVSPAILIEVSEPTKEDNPPILLKNDKLVKQTEFITDMYSAPNYREYDPNKMVFFFFMIFMGVIMADIGYGVLMTLAGLYLSSRIKIENGTKKLWNIIAISGVFTVFFGVLFNSLFGFSVLPFTILPSPVPDGNGTENLMIILLGCLGLGVVHIATGYLCKALNCFMHKEILDGILDGLIWVAFFIGFIFASFIFLMDYFKISLSVGLRAFFDKMTMPGLILVIGSLLVAVVTAGRKEKGFSKFTKGFGQLYGLISIFSDILSYARLFGLMLSGMIIGQTFNDMGLNIMSSGGIAVVFGFLVMAVGHIFNIAMGVLGAYIHDSRLQYIEFFGKFYTGEGNKFTPFGSDLDYIYLKK